MVVAPSFFGNIELGSIPAQEEQMLIGRVVEATLYDITGDFSHHYLKMFFQIHAEIGRAKQQEPSSKDTNTHVTS
jgi:small subunit ribosomal protein S3Ae